MKSTLRRFRADHCWMVNDQRGELGIVFHVRIAFLFPIGDGRNGIP